MTIILGILIEGLIYAIMALGVYVTYKILDFPDLSVDSTFPLGAALASTLILAGVNPVLSLVFATIAGALAGCVTGLIHVKCKVRDLLSGIIVMTGLYSINLRIAGGKSNQPIFSQETIFENQFLSNYLPESLSPYATVIILLIIVLLCKFLLDLYLKTRSGYLLRAAGDNEVLVTSLAKDKGKVKIIGLAIANAFAALAGAVYCQQKGYFEITIGTGSMVISLASVIIGTQFFGRFKKVKATTAVVCGAILYQACVSLAISFGMEPSDLKLITSMLFLLILIAGNLKGKKGNIYD